MGEGYVAISGSFLFPVLGPVAVGPELQFFVQDGVVYCAVGLGAGVPRAGSLAITLNSVTNSGAPPQSLPPVLSALSRLGASDATASWGVGSAGFYFGESRSLFTGARSINYGTGSPQAGGSVLVVIPLTAFRSK
jgi:hypothetical protein